MPPINRRLAIINQGPRLLSLARTKTGDVNQAHLFVHTVIAEALGDAAGVSLQKMESRLKALLGKYATQQAFTSICCPAGD
jgi:L,D-peptidoglycan transpeptidase YkuD (ErfK/YbiS/YcfS/YnhG family)